MLGYIVTAGRKAPHSRSVIWLGFAAALALSSRANAGPAVADITFVTGHEWVQLTGDEPRGLFRMYAAALDQGGKVIDFPNMFIMHCKDQERYLTIHFPEGYALKGIETSTWIPESEVHVRYGGGTLNFRAELNDKEFHIDFDADDFANLAIFLHGPAAEMKLGPSLDTVSLRFGGAEIDAAQESTLSSRLTDGRRVEAKHSLQEIAWQCFGPGPSVKGAKYWVATGIMICPDCDGSKGEISTHIKIGGKRGSSIRSRAECLKAIKITSAAANENGLLAVLQCSNVSDPTAD